MINNNFAMKIIYSFRLIYNEYCGNDKYRFRYYFTACNHYK